MDTCRTKCHNNILTVVPPLPTEAGREIQQITTVANVESFRFPHSYVCIQYIQDLPFHLHWGSGLQIKTLSCKHYNHCVNVLVRLDFQENNHHANDTHSTMTDLMELRHRTAQHSGDEPAREDVFCFPSLSLQIKPFKLMPRWELNGHVWTVQSLLSVRHVEVRLRNGESVQRPHHQPVSSSVCHITFSLSQCLFTSLRLQQHVLR